MDISKIKDEVAKDEEGATVTVYQKNGDPYLAADGTTPCTFTVVGDESKRVRQAKDRQTKRVLRDRQREIEPGDLRTNRIELAAAGLIDWSGWESDGQPVPCTADNAKTLLGSADHLLEQAEEAIRRHARFFVERSSG